ncbi:MAG: ATP synthase F1 subunit delta [Planctomycetota bacterium]
MNVGQAMSSGNERETGIARIYATAMLNLSKPSGHADGLRQELADVAGLLDGQPEFEAFLSNPTVGAEVRQRMIEKVFRGRFSDVLVDSLQVLNRKDRLGLIRSIADAYRLLHDELMKRIEVHVRTAVPLNEALRAQLRVKLSVKTGKQVELVETVDETLIGGMIVQIHDEKYDNSVLRKLLTLGRNFLDRASREIYSGRTYTAGHAGQG